MYITEIINTETPVLKATDSISYAVKLMDLQAVDHLPVTDNATKKLIGLIDRKQLTGMTESKKPLHTLEIAEMTKVYAQQHIFEAIRIMLQYELDYLPVTDSQMTYQGTVEKQVALESLALMLNLPARGSVLKIELEKRDFSLSEIVQIVEMEGAKILGITVETPSAKSKTFNISIKLNTLDIAGVVSALKRYDYHVTAEGQTPAAGMDLETRADELIKFIDM